MRPNDRRQLTTRPSTRGALRGRARALAQRESRTGKGFWAKGLAFAAMLASTVIVGKLALGGRPRLELAPPPSIDQHRVDRAATSDTASQTLWRRIEQAVPAGTELHLAPVSGIVQSTHGEPLDGASICMVPARMQCCAAQSCVVSDAAGRFSLEASVVNSAIVIASAEGYLPLRRPFLESSRGTSLVLSLEPGGVRLTGNVVDASGGAVLAALVSASGAGDTALAFARTASAGRFALTVPEGTLQLSARADGYSSVVRQIDAPHDDIELILTAASSLRGHVLARETREPVAGTEVRVFDANGLQLGSRRATTDEGGAFAIEGLAAGGYFVDASSAEWRSARSGFFLEIAEEKTLDLAVDPATRFNGKVRAGGATCQRGRVSLEGPVPGFRELDSNGEVAFEGVLPGAYRAHVSCEPGMELTDEIEVGLQSVTRDWDLNPGSSLTGVVMWGDALPLARARVEVDPIGEPRSRRSVVCSSNDEHGAFSCFGLEPGEYACQLRENAVARSEIVPVTLREGSSPPTVVLRANPTASLHIRIENAASLQLEALTVVAQRKGSAPRPADRKGSEFVLERIPLGVYDVMLDPEVAGGRRTVELMNAGAVVDLSLTPPPGRTLSGRVVDERGNGVPDAWVRVSGTSPYGALFPASPVMSDAEGAFTIPGLLQGSYELSAASSRGEARLDDVANDGRRVLVPLRTDGSL
jgi:hypothetical protein